MTSVFRKTGLMLLLGTATVFTVHAGTGIDKLKKHKCNAECKPGAHMYKHGEKGHKCTAACKTAKM